MGKGARSRAARAQELAVRPALPGWEVRVRDHTRGKRDWPVAHAQVTPTPWPFDWTLLEPVGRAHPDTVSAERGYTLGTGTCSVSGAHVTHTDGVRCARCGSTLSERSADIRARSFGDEIPSCPGGCRREVVRLVAECERNIAAGVYAGVPL